MCLKIVSYKFIPLQFFQRYNLPAGMLGKASGPGLTDLARQTHPILSFLLAAWSFYHCKVIVKLHPPDLMSLSLIYVEKLDPTCAI